MHKGFRNSKIKEVRQNRSTEFYFFLKEVSQASFHNAHRPDLVYPLLEANLDKLNYEFIKWLQEWMPHNLFKLNLKMQQI